MLRANPLLPLPAVNLIAASQLTTRMKECDNASAASTLFTNMLNDAEKYHNTVSCAAAAVYLLGGNRVNSEARASLMAKLQAPEEFKRIFGDYDSFLSSLTDEAVNTYRVSKEALVQDFAKFAPDSSPLIATRAPFADEYEEVKQHAVVEMDAKTYDISKSRASYKKLTHNNTPNDIVGLFRDYAHPRLFSFHWFRHHRVLADQIVAKLSAGGSFEEISTYLIGVRDGMAENPKVNQSGSMMRRLNHAVALLSDNGHFEAVAMLKTESALKL